MCSPLLIVALVCIALTGGSRTTMAANTPDSATRVALERDLARTELDRLNADIDALKQRRRGIGDDYQLRRKMADAEALARRLTQLESRMAPVPQTAASGASTESLLPAPRPSASDDREVREAKADILADQARRLDQQVSLLERRVDDLRVRQELRRRAGDLERDPFSPLEQAKRRLPLGTATSIAERAAPERPNAQAASPTPGPGSSSGATTLVGVQDSTKGIGQVATAAGTTNPAAVPVPIAQGGAPESTASLATQFREILDPSTLAEIRKLEGSGSETARLPAAERALAALRARARQLKASADAMRATSPLPQH